MYISKLSIVNYRNFAIATLRFDKGVNTIIGENGAGKSNIFRAMRLLLDDNMVRAAYRLEESDFHRSLGQWKGHWIIISLEFEEIGPEEAIQALFLHGAGVVEGEAVGRATYNLVFRPKKDVRQKLSGLDDGDMIGLAAIRQAMTIADYETVFTGRSDVDFCDPAIYRELVGDFDHCIFPEEIDDPRIGARMPQFLSVTQEISFTFIQALRDVVAEFHNSRTNPLLTLLKSQSGEIAPAIMAPIVAQVQVLNNSIEALEDVQKVRSDIRDTIKDATGETYSPTSLSIKSDLSDEADRLFQSLRLFVGESGEGYEGAIHELSLGGANLIFLTLKLLEFKYQKAKAPIANFLLIEEPEAHIHTHIQKTLFDRIAYEDTQIIYSTHSTHISEVSNIERVNILGRNGTACEAYQPAQGLSPTQIGNVQRYLDAVRSNLLFARSVVLVEGDAEEILIPILFKKILGVSLDELGVSLINIRSTGFENVADLFDDNRIRKRCSIVTDLDTAVWDTTPVPGEPPADAKFRAKCRAAQAKGADRRDRLELYSQGNPWLSTYYATHTFEVELIAAGNAAQVASIVPQVYVDPPTQALARAELMSGDVGRYGKRVLTMAKHEGKGWFAILLGRYVSHQTTLPAYIHQAIFFARNALTSELFFDIYNHRLQCALAVDAVTQAVADVADARLRAYREGAMDLVALKNAMIEALPHDQIHAILGEVE
ncbi:ATP-dependent nuclease [Cupriavidus lacunae]|uniref:ATP-dependent endonuclease n=1 Tax=Cupriavidus lacunae TaxID=2666307 RepID=A0A370NH65_9BURK|nr:AAA family ATPase [Cupriavidus lacunae]RDK04957.1 ATP-dependent endonuclease [Cupriavidus lacunae]